MPRRKATKSVSSRKAKRSQNFNNKQVKIIKTRLIQISMRMEDYVYQKTPISESEAEQFIREVSSYKTECSKDERSLQVIEKLTRCMKAIIIEHQQQRSMTHTTYDEQCYIDDDRACATSPVYSLPDEDRTQFTQENIDNNIYTDQYNIPHIEQHNVTVDNNEAEEIINLSDDDDNENGMTIKTLNTVNSVMTAERSVDVNINNALSNLSLRESPERMETDAGCSQSILDNYQQVTQNIQQNDTTIRRITLENGKIVRDVRRASGKQHIKLLNQIAEANTTSKVTVKNLNITNTRVNDGVYNMNHPLIAKVSKAINNTFTSAGKTTSLETNKNYTTVNNIIRNDNTNIDQNQTPVIKNKLLSNKTSDIHKGQEVPKITKILKGKSNTQNGNTNTPSIIKKKGRPRKQKLSEPKTKDNRKLCIEHLTQQSCNDKNNSNTMKTVVKKKCRRNKVSNEHNEHRKNTRVPIYNKNVENDLSWLENIRYVREIGEDEYEKISNLSNNFWDNCLLPPNFDEGDFII